MLLVDDDLILVLVNAVVHALLNEVLEQLHITTISRNTESLWLRRCSVPARDNGLANAVVDPDGLTFVLEDVVSGTSLELNLRFGLLVLDLEDLLPPVDATSFFDATTEVTVILDHVLFLHEPINPVERVIVIPDIDRAVEPLLYLEP